MTQNMQRLADMAEKLVSPEAFRRDETGFAMNP